MAEHDRADPEARDLAALAAPPSWLRDLGATAWLLVGITLVVVAAIWILSLTRTIVGPVLAATVVAAVASPLVARLERRGVSRGFGAVLVLIGLLVLAAAVLGIVIGGITSQFDELRAQLSSAKDVLTGWLADAGIDADAAAAARDEASSTSSDAVKALLEGVGGALRGLSSLVVFLSLAALSLVFLLKDGPVIRNWAEGHMRVPRPVAHKIGERVLQSLRGYFLGVTIVAAFNAVLVGVAALLLGIPLAGTIAAVTFVGAYVPYLGAWGAGAFSVLIALGGAGTEAAAAMIVVQLLANGALQQLVQPIAYGAALGIHPLAVLIVTIAGGALFGAVGLILAAPLTSAAVRIAADLGSAAGAGGPAEVADEQRDHGDEVDLPEQRFEHREGVT
jgi:predicted PurR-regulated permease PerM